MFINIKVTRHLFVLFVILSIVSTVGCGKVAFYSNRTGNTEIFTVRDNGTNLQQLTNSPGDDYGPVYTPDGEKIVFTSNRTGDEEIFIMAENGTNPTNLTNNPGKRDWFPVVSPSGTHIAYWKERELGGGAQLNIMKIDGTGKIVLSNTNSPLYPEPHVFSPSGKMLAYADSALSNKFYPKLYLVNADGTNRHALTNDYVEELRPMFTCDDKKVIFNSMRDGNWEIYSIGVDGSGLKNLTNNTAFDFISELSPDCSKILFESERTGNREIFIMNIDGSGIFQLTSNPGDDVAAFFSPDGQKVGLISRPGTSGEYDLWVINSNGTGIHKVSSPVSKGATCCPKYQFSKNSKKILFHSILPGNKFEIFIVNADGTNLINLSNNPANDLGESFKP